MSPAARPPAPADRRFLTGLIGAPIAHSASPAMHERAAEALGAHCHYQLIEVAGAGREELQLLLDGVRRLGFAGVNVTFPYRRRWSTCSTNCRRARKRSVRSTPSWSAMAG
jgi:shikimate dehydrogenase